MLYSLHIVETYLIPQFCSCIAAADSSDIELTSSMEEVISLMEADFPFRDNILHYICDHATGIGYIFNYLSYFAYGRCTGFSLCGTLLYRE